MAFLAGQTLNAAALNRQPGRVIGRAERLSSTGTTTTTELAVLRLDDISLDSSRLYSISCSGAVLDSSVNGDSCTIRLRATTDGSTPTTSSALLTAVATDVPAPNAQAVVPILRWYRPSGDETLSVLLSVVRLSGTGNVSIVYAAGFPIDIVITEHGVDPGDTGVELP